MVSTIGAKEFREIVKGKIKQIDKEIKDEDLYFSQTVYGYFLEYNPDYPNSSDEYFLVHQDSFKGCVSVLGKDKSLYPGLHRYGSIFDFEDEQISNKD